MNSWGNKQVCALHSSMHALQTDTLAIIIIITDHHIAKNVEFRAEDEMTSPK